MPIQHTDVPEEIIKLLSTEHQLIRNDWNCNDYL